MLENPEGPRGPSRSWKQNPEAVRADILRAATAQFARHGLAGTPIQDIADQTNTSKRMIFYYFGDKEGLYRAVLEKAYREVRDGEKKLNLEGLQPIEALIRLVEFSFEHHRANWDFIRLVMIENIHGSEHLANVEGLSKINSTVIDQLSNICDAGKKAGIFRTDVSALSLHWQISAMCFFNVSNRPTFSTLFGDDLFTEKAQAQLCDQIVRSVLAAVVLPEELGKIERCSAAAG
ncbi:MAG: TetR family transcriptional regulator [Rhodospirillaceae bacterium]|nr:TetR family transcriptional regulator [Rhodospirillaceae bacterium]